MAGERGAGVLTGASVAQTLAALKREGSNILLVGTELPETHTAVCHRLLGDGESVPRYRLFVTDSGGTGTTDERTGDEAVTARTIDYSALTLAGESPVDAVSERAPLGTLGTEIVETIDELDEAADGLEPSALRVCVDSLAPLLDEHTAERVFRLLHVTTRRTEHVHGMGHYHLPLERDHEAVQLFEPLFDVIVEVRAEGDSYEQRWEFGTAERATEWISF